MHEKCLNSLLLHILFFFSLFYHALNQSLSLRGGRVLCGRFLICFAVRMTRFFRTLSVNGLTTTTTPMLWFSIFSTAEKIEEK